MKDDSEKNSEKGNINVNGDYSDNSLHENNDTDPNKAISSTVIIKMRKGDHKAFESIFHAFYSKVKSFIKAFTKTDDLAEELSQQVFVDLWINREKINPDKNVAAYIYTMARNSAITAIKQQLRFEIIGLDSYEEMDNLMTDDALIAKETELLINLTVAGMPPKRRLVYNMSRHENKDNEQIAKELKISRKVVEKHLRLAVNELRNAIKLMSLLLY